MAPARRAAAKNVSKIPSGLRERGLPPPGEPEAFMDSARIGPSIRITGDISADEPLIIDGTVVGSIELTSHPVTINEGATVEATILAHSVTVSGAVRGSIHASARIVVEKTASIDGDLVAPSISVQDGATIHGRLEIEGRREKKLALAS
jgi:cytoskeletal protein CcmA (bactofilin family)